MNLLQCLNLHKSVQWELIKANSTLRDSDVFGPTTELWEKTQLHSRGPDESAPETNGQQLPGSLSASAAKINMCRGNAPVK